MLFRRAEASTHGYVDTGDICRSSSQAACGCRCTDRSSMIEGTEGGGAVAADVADVAVDEEDDEEVDEGYDVEDGGTGKYCSRRISRSPITMSNVRICIKKKSE